MTAKMRHCWFCGAELGVIENRNYDRMDTCGSRECDREVREVSQAERDEVMARFRAGRGATTGVVHIERIATYENTKDDRIADEQASQKEQEP